MKKQLRKLFAISMIMMLTISMSPIHSTVVKADRITGDIEINAKADANADSSGGSDSSSSGGGSGTGTGGTGGSGGSGTGGGGGDGDGGSSSSSSAWAKAEAHALAQLINGRHVDLSAYLLESVQGFNRGTYVPEFKHAVDNDFMYEYSTTALRENRFFGEANKRKFVFNQDGKFDDEYVEALNWLYANNLVQTFESLNVGYTEPDSWESDKKNSVAAITSNGGVPEDKKDIELPAGKYIIEYDMYGIPDKMKVVDKDGKELASTGGDVSGPGSFEVVLEEDGVITVIMNEGDGNDGTAWEYNILDPSKTNDYGPMAKSVVTLTEQKEKESYLYPIKEEGKSKINRPIERKDFVMQLMKSVDGIEESRPLMIESQYAYQNLSGKLNLQRSLIEQLRTKFKDQLGATGMDSAINDIKIEFNKYGMHYYYVNPNVYELYLQKAHNSGIILPSEIKDKNFLKAIQTGEGFEGTLDLDVESEPTEDAGDSTAIEDGESCSAEQKIGKALPKWSNQLPPVRVNTKRAVDNNYYFNTQAGTNIFGSSWSDTSTDCSNTKGDHDFTYNGKHEYFTRQHLSYTDAVMYAYKAINAYSDEKLPEREVKTIMSMYSVNYGNLTDEEIQALNYLIAKGIIDGDDAAKYTSPENITVKDAIVLSYRIANPSARLTFKRIYESVDEAMLERGFGQSKTSVKSYSGDLPEMEISTTEKDDYYVIMNDKLEENNYFLGHVKFTELKMDGVTKVDETYTSEQLEKLGIKLPNGKYKVRKYSVPWNAIIDRIGLTLTEDKEGLPTWIDMKMGGGFYYIDESLLDGKTKELKFERAYSNLTLLRETPAVQSGKPVSAEEKLKEHNDKLNEDKNKKDDPLDLISYNGTINGSGTIKARKFFAGDKKDETVKIFLGINEKTKGHIMLDGMPLFNNGKINEALLQELEDIKNIKEVEGVPTDDTGQKVSSDDKKVFLEFVFPKTGQRSVSELKSLLQRRLTLTGEAELRDEDIASYTGLSDGQTMISRKELKRFGITTTKEEPDILVHEDTKTYAYLNTEKDYALISNTVVKFPSNSLMIEISGDEIYYNINVIMSMLNDKDFYVFNSEGKFEIVQSMKNIKKETIYNPETERSLDTTFTADVYKYNPTNKSKEIKVGEYINITAIAETPATFFLTSDKTGGNKRMIYGFEPYYVKTKPTSTDDSVNPGKVIEELTMEVADVIQVENMLINNALLRNEFDIPTSETFIYTDNAIKMTLLTRSQNISYYAENFIDMASTIANGLSEKDIKVNADTFKESNPFLRNKDFELEDLLDRRLYVNGEDARVKSWIADVKKGKNVEAFWTLYFMDKFTPDIPYTVDEATGKQGQSQEEAFKKKVMELYNKKYSNLPSNKKLTKLEDLELLRTTTISETDIAEKRLFTIKRLIDAPNDGLISTDDLVYVNKNDAVYMQLPSYVEGKFQSQTSSLTDDKSVVSINVPKFFADGVVGNASKVPSSVEKDLKPSKDILGTGFYRQNNRVYSPVIEQYKSLPRGEKPLETFSNGHKFKMTTVNGEEEFVVVNNMVVSGGKSNHTDKVMMKIARVNAKPLSEYSGVKGTTSRERLYNYYNDVNNYVESIKSLGGFSTAVNSKVNGSEYAIKYSEVNRGTSQNITQGDVYFDYSGKKANTVYVFATDLTSSLDKTKFLPTYTRNKNSYSITEDMASKNTKLIFDITPLSDTGGNKSQPSNKNPNKYLYAYDTIIDEEYMVYDSFLINYGTVSLNNENKASLNKRTDYILNSSPVLTDLVNELVKALRMDRVDAKPMKVGDLVNKDKLLILEGEKGKNDDFILIKTGTKDKNGYSHFITTRASTNNLTPEELEYSNTILLKNYNLFDSIKISANKERKSLYYFIGNQQLNLASSNHINTYKSDLEFSNLNSESTMLVEDNSKVKEFKINIDLGNKDMSNGAVREIKQEDMTKGYPYFIALYLDSNLLVKKNDAGYYEIIGYAENDLINTEAFTSRANRFKGVYDSLLTVLPTYSSIDGKFLGFNLEKLEIDNIKKLFTFKYWDDLITNALANVEQVLAGLGIYYVYLLLVLVILGRTLPGVVYTWVFNPVKILTLGRIDIDTLNMGKFVSKSLFVIVLLTLMYNGFIRVLILKAEEVRTVVAEYFIYPFL